MGEVETSKKSVSTILLGMLIAVTGAALPLRSDVYISLKLPILLVSLTLVIIYLWKNRKFFSPIEIRTPVILVMCFLFTLTLSSSVSTPNLKLFLWGTSGRGNGWALYFALVILLVLSIKIANQIDSKALLKLLLIYQLFTLAVFYGQYLRLFSLGDFNYSLMVGYFGNPNFTSAFLGMFCAISLGILIFGDFWRLFSGFISLATIYEIYLSSSLQGFLVVCLIMSLYVSIILIRSKVKIHLKLIYFIALGISLLIGLLGLVGTGPAGPILERTSFKIRLGYFESALTMFWNKPLTGVGVDSYGDFFREVRPDWLIKLITDSTTSNDAHSVYLNLLATSGVFPFLFFLSFNLYCLYLGMKASLKVKNDYFLIICLGFFVGFQVQSLISINHVGIAIWGWAFAGIIFARSQSILSDGTPPLLDLKPVIRKIITFTSLVMVILLSILGFIRIYESIQLKIATQQTLTGISSELKERKFLQLAELAGYWIPDVANSLILQEAFLNLGASEAAGTIAKATYSVNPNSRDALWALIAIETRRGNFVEAITLREKLIRKEKESWWVLLDQAESYAETKNMLKAGEYLNRAKSKADVEPARVALIQAKIDLIS